MYSQLVGRFESRVKDLMRAAGNAVNEGISDLARRAVRLSVLDFLSSSKKLRGLEIKEI